MLMVSGGRKMETPEKRSSHRSLRSRLSKTGTEPRPKGAVGQEQTDLAVKALTRRLCIISTRQALQAVATL